MWPLINTNNVTKLPPEYEKIQKGNTWRQRQGLLSTKTVEPTKVESEDKNNNQHEKRNDILIVSYDMEKTMYIDMISKLPHSSGWGNI